MQLSNWLWAETRQAHGIALVRLFELLMRYVQSHWAIGVDHFARALLQDYQRDGRTDTPPFPSDRSPVALHTKKSTPSTGLGRQLRHAIG
jgi:hypothetical protein